MAPWIRESKDWLFLVCLNATVPITIGWKVHTGEASATIAIVSGLTSLVVLNAFLILMICARNKRQGQGVPRSLIMGAIGLMMTGASLTYLIVSTVPAHNNYLELALSAKPLNDIHPAQTELVVELLRRRLANSRAYSQLAANTKPVSPSLFSLDSFANESTIRSVSGAYKNAADADFAYYAQQQEAMNDFRTKMMKVNPEFVKSFEAQETEDAESYKKEKESAAAILGLYQYALIHAADFKVSNGKLMFATESVRLEFSRQLESSKALFSKSQANVQERVRQQQARASTSPTVQ